MVGAETLAWGCSYADLVRHARCMQNVLSDDGIVEVSAEEVVDVGWVFFCAYVGILISSFCRALETAFECAAKVCFCFVLLYFLRAEGILVGITVGYWLHVLQFSWANLSGTC